MKKYFKSFGTSTLTTEFPAPLFGQVAGTARALGCSCAIATEIVDDEQQFTPMLRAVLTGTDTALDELIYTLWEKWEISEAA